MAPSWLLVVVASTELSFTILVRIGRSWSATGWSPESKDGLREKSTWNWSRSIIDISGIREVGFLIEASDICQSKWSFAIYAIKNCWEKFLKKQQIIRNICRFMGSSVFGRALTSNILWSPFVRQWYHHLCLCVHLPESIWLTAHWELYTQFTNSCTVVHKFCGFRETPTPKKFNNWKRNLNFFQLFVNVLHWSDSQDQIFIDVTVTECQM